MDNSDFKIITSCFVKNVPNILTKLATMETSISHNSTIFYIKTSIAQQYLNTRESLYFKRSESYFFLFTIQC
jgi:hypothetical protein